jgi:DNA excision repair protein ERCC-3
VPTNNGLTVTVPKRTVIFLCDLVKTIKKWLQRSSEMNVVADRPLIVQNDFTVLFETDHPDADDIRQTLNRFTELVKSPEHLHTYRITTISLWNAAASEMSAQEIITFLIDYGKFGLPASVREFIIRMMSRYGSLRLEPGEPYLQLVADEWQIIREVSEIAMVKAYFCGRIGALRIAVDPVHRGDIKRELLRAGYPVIDLVGYHQGELLPVQMNANSEGSTNPLRLRDYQLEAVDQFYKDGRIDGGSGVIVLPCGSGKTIVGIAAMARLNCATLILTSSVTSVQQWKRELLNKTDVDETWIGEYTGSFKEVKPITIATYHILTHRKNKDGPLLHMRLFNERDWGLIIYDEVHLLPAPVFRMTAAIQATRRLGLTATLIREDGHEGDVFSLIGPKRYEQRWKALENSGWIASAICVEIAINMQPVDRQRYVLAAKSAKHRIAGENPMKIDIIKQLLDHHNGCQIIVIGQYIKQLQQVAQQLNAPLITGKMPQREREVIYNQFKDAEIRVLVVSKVANFAVDLPEANVALQISGSFGSRQEEAQRLGRILRPKDGDNQAYFYTLVTEDSCEIEFARHRQLFLIEQGYTYLQQKVSRSEEWVHSL